MRSPSIVFCATTLAASAAAFAPTPASAQVFCRCECQVQVMPWGNGFVRRRICRRHCWREAPRYAEPPPVYRYYTPPAPTYRPPQQQYATPYRPTPAPPPRPRAQAEGDPEFPAKAIAFLAFVAAVIGGVTLIAKLVAYLHALDQQHRADRIARKTVSARELKRRLEADARAADAMIAAYVREASRRGRAF
jgi:hypothetical protein